MSKQTALQWFKEMVELNHGHVPQDIYKQALQMEREQIIDAYYYDPNCDEIKDDGEQYYNEIYGEKFGEKFGGQDE